MLDNINEFLDTKEWILNYFSMDDTHALILVKLCPKTFDVTQPLSYLDHSAAFVRGMVTGELPLNFQLALKELLKEYPSFPFIILGDNIFESLQRMEGMIHIWRQKGLIDLATSRLESIIERSDHI